MVVYILTQDFPYEGVNILGVYSSIEKAEAEANRHSTEDREVSFFQQTESCRVADMGWFIYDITMYEVE